MEKFTGIFALLFLLHSQIISAQSTSITLGTGTGTNSVTGYPAPYGPYNGSSKHQILILGSELRAAGVSASGITTLAFNISTPPTAPLLGFTIKMKTTTQNSLGTSFDSDGMITVSGPTDLTITSTGWYTHNLTPAIFWNGDSTTNILIETCFNNNATSGTNAQLYYTTTPFTSVVYKNGNLASQCAATTGGITSSNRPNMKISYTPPGQLGGGNTTNGTTSYPAPYGNFYQGARHHFLITAAEMRGAGFAAGTIESLSFNVQTKQGAALENFTISMKQTSATALTGTFDGADLTTVWGPETYTEDAGWNEHIFTAPFIWDGTSNILIETCFNNSSYTNNAQCYYSPTSHISAAYYRADAQGVCSSTSTATTSTTRTNMRFRFVKEAIGNDAGIFSLLLPDSGCGSDNMPIPVVIKNFSDSALSAIPVAVEVSGSQSATFTDTLAGPLAAGDLDTIVVGTLNAGSGGNFTIKSYTSMNNDLRPVNDTLLKTIILLPGTVPNAAFTYTISGLIVDFSASQQDALSYLWNFGDMNTNQEKNPQHTYQAEGQYAVSLKVSTDCGADSSQQTVTVGSGSGISEYSLTSLSIFPVVNKGEFTVSLAYPGENIAELSIVNPIGQLIHSEKLTTVNNRLQKVIHIDRTAPGFYLLRVKTNTALLTGKVIIE